MTINYENEYDFSFDFDLKQTANDVIMTALDYAKCPYEINVNVLITDNDTIKGINKEYRNIDSATDVLSFPMIEYPAAGDFTFLESEAEYDYFDPESGELLLGDIIISGDRVISQSKEYGHTAKREFAFLVAHSMFHLFGYDHMSEEEAKEMEQKQEDVLKLLKITRNGD